MALGSVLAGQLFLQHSKVLYLIDEFDREYKRVQRPSAAVAKVCSAIRLDDMLRRTELDDHEKESQYVAELDRYLNVSAPPHPHLLGNASPCCERLPPLHRRRSS